MAGAIDWSELLHPDFEDIRSMLHQWYVKDRLSLLAVSEKLGINSAPLRKKLIALNIELHAKGKPSATNIRVEKQQKPNKPTEYDYQLIAEGIRLGMVPENYDGKTRIKEIRSCNLYRSCETYTAILHGLVVPCYKCTGTPEYIESMNRTLPEFNKLLNSLGDRKSNRRDYERKVNNSRSDAQVMRDWLDREKIDTSRLFVNKRFEVYYQEEQLYRKSIIKINDSDILDLIRDIPGITLRKMITHFKSTHYFMGNKIRELKLDGKITYKYPGRYFVKGN